MATFWLITPSVNRHAHFSRTLLTSWLFVDLQHFIVDKFTQHYSSISLQPRYLSAKYAGFISQRYLHSLWDQLNFSVFDVQFVRKDAWNRRAGKRQLRHVILTQLRQFHRLANVYIILYLCRTLRWTTRGVDSSACIMGDFPGRPYEYTWRLEYMEERTTVYKRFESGFHQQWWQI